MVMGTRDSLRAGAEAYLRNEYLLDEEEQRRHDHAIRCHCMEAPVVVTQSSWGLSWWAVGMMIGIIVGRLL
jgi:hypothetical protein